LNPQTFDPETYESHASNSDRKYKYRLRIDNSKFVQAEISTKWNERFEEAMNHKIKMYGPLVDVEPNDAILDHMTVHGPLQHVKRYVDCLTECVVTELYNEAVFTRDDYTKMSRKSIPMVLVIQVSSFLYNKFQSRRHRQMFEMIGDLMCSASYNVDRFNRRKIHAVITNGREVQFAILDSTSIGYELTVSHVLQIGSFEQTTDGNYDYFFRPKHSDLTIILGVMRSMIHSSEIIVEEKQTIVEEDIDNNFPVARTTTPVVKDSSSAIQYLQSLYGKRSQSPTNRDSLHRSELSPEQASAILKHASIKRRIEFSPIYRRYQYHFAS
jgi:hypothetical protein